MAFITIHTICTKTSLSASTARVKRGRGLLGQANQHHAEEDGEEDDLEHGHVGQSPEDVGGHHVHEGLQGPLDLVRSALVSLSMTQSFIWTDSPVIASTLDSSRGSVSRLMSSRTSMPLASRQSS